MNFQHYARSLMFSLFCLAFQATTFAQTTFVGAANGDWFTASNWNNGLPAAGNDATIPGGASVVIGAPLTTNFGVNSFGAITLNNAELTVASGAFASSGTFTVAATARITVNAGATFNNFGAMTNNGVIIVKGSFSSNQPFTNTATGIFNNESNANFNANIINNGIISNRAGTFTTTQNIINSNTVENGAGANFKLEFGASFDNTVGGVCNNAGTFTNTGTFNNAATVSNTSTFINFVVIENAANATFSNRSGARIENNQTIRNAGAFVNEASATLVSSNFVNNAGFVNSGIFTNNATFDNTMTGVFNNENGAVLTSGFGSQITNSNVFNIKANSTIAGNAQITNNKTLTIDGIVDLQLGSVLTNTATVVNNGVLKNVNTINNNASGIFTNNGTIENNSGGSLNNAATFINSTSGKILNSYEITNKATGVFTNNGSFSNLVRCFNEGQLTNNGFLNIVGDFFNRTGATFTNNEVVDIAEGSLVNEGTLINRRTIVNEVCSFLKNTASINNTGGSIKNLGLTFQRGTVTGNAIVNTNGYIHTAATSAADICQNVEVGINQVGEAKLYAQSSIRIKQIDSCNAFVYTSNGVARPVFTCAQVNTTQTVNIRLTTRTGDSLTCVAQARIVDSLAPAFTNCPKDATVLTSDTFAIFAWTAPTVVDNCTATPTVSSSKASGSRFAIGTTIVTITALDALRNSNACQFRVNVVKVPANGTCPANDVTKPVFANCPANITVNTANGVAVVDWIEPTATDNCYPVTVRTSNSAGSVFQAGTTTVTYTATDSKSNIGTCSFTVTVPTAADACATDNIAPVIKNCPVNFFATTNTNINGAVAFWTAPTVSDNCGSATLTSNFASGSIFPTGTTTVTYTAKDAKNNTSTCAFVVTVGLRDLCVGDVTPPIINGCPTNINVTTSGNSATAIWNVPTATDACGVPTLNSTNAPNTAFPVGETIVTYTASDAKGNASTCSFKVTVVNPCQSDTTRPAISNCPANITKVVTTPTAVATWTAPTATDNCSGLTFLSNFNSGTAFPVGTTTVVYRATDARGNRNTCAFDVTVSNTGACIANSSTGGLTRQVWNNLAGGTSLQILLSDARYPNNPTSTNTITAFEGPMNIGDNYGTRVRGFIRPTVTGTYNFTVTGDDDCELYLSTDLTAANKTRIAYFAGWTYPQEYTKYPTQKSANITLQAGVNYYVELLHQEGGGGDFFNVAWQLNGGALATVPGSVLVPYIECPTTPTCVRTKGSIVRETWTNISGSLTSDLVNNPAFQNPANTTTSLTSFKIPINLADNYGDRVRGFIYPPNTGAYTFYVYGDDQVELFLSSDNTAANKQRIAYVGSWTFENELTREPNQKSASINLVAGKEYYIELLHKEGAGGDNFGVLWQIPTTTTAPNLVVNGDFNSGNVGFQSDFTIANGGSFCGAWIVTDAPNVQWGFPPANCVPAGKGQVLAIDNSSVAHQRAWYQTLLTQVNTTYNFSIRTASLYPSSPARLVLTVNGVAVSNVVTLPTTTCKWTTISGTWNSGNCTNPTIAIVNQNGDCSGNDYAIDDIVFSAVSTSAMIVDGAFLAPFDVCKPTPTVCILPNGLYREVWSNNPQFVQPIVIPTTTPTSTSVIPVSEGPSNIGDNYTTRVRGFIKPTVTGSYTFAETGDDYTELWLSSDENAANARRIAYHYDWTLPFEFSKYPTQIAPPVTLTAGKLYYVELRHVEFGGGDNFQILWKTPSNQAAFNIIPTENCFRACSYSTAITGSNNAKVFAFTAHKDYKTAQLQWISNRRTDYYVVERSDYSGNFTALQYVNGDVNQQDGDLITFNAKDIAPYDDVNYYRIRQVFHDGTEVTSDPKRLDFGKLSDIRLFPNPADEVVNVDLSRYEGQTVRLALYNQLGQEVYRTVIEKATRAPFELSTANFLVGSYLLHVATDGKRDQQRTLIIAR